MCRSVFAGSGFVDVVLGRRPQPRDEVVLVVTEDEVLEALEPGERDDAARRVDVGLLKVVGGRPGLESALVRGGEGVDDLRREAGGLRVAAVELQAVLARDPAGRVVQREVEGRRDAGLVLRDGADALVEGVVGDEPRGHALGGGREREEQDREQQQSRGKTPLQDRSAAPFQHHRIHPRQRHSPRAPCVSGRSEAEGNAGGWENAKIDR